MEQLAISQINLMLIKAKMNLIIEVSVLFVLPERTPTSIIFSHAVRVSSRSWHHVDDPFSQREGKNSTLVQINIEYKKIKKKKTIHTVLISNELQTEKKQLTKDKQV